MFMWHRKKIVEGKDGRIHQLKQFINCGTEYVVYGIICPCGRLYVGRTSHPMRVRIANINVTLLIQELNTLFLSTSRKPTPTGRPIRYEGFLG